MIMGQILIRYKAAILQGFTQIPDRNFPGNGSERTLDFSGFYPVPFFSLSPTLNPGTVTVQLQSSHRTVTKLELFPSDSGAVL